jgi:hypothetical protein
VVGYDIFFAGGQTSPPSTPPESGAGTSSSPGLIGPSEYSLHLNSTVLQTEPLLQTVGNQDSVAERDPDLLRFVLFLYMIRCPHSLQRMGSRGLISFLAPQSSIQINTRYCSRRHVSHQHTNTPYPASEEAQRARRRQSWAVLVDSSWFLNKRVVTVVTRLLACCRSRCDGFLAVHRSTQLFLQQTPCLCYYQRCTFCPIVAPVSRSGPASGRSRHRRKTKRIWDKTPWNGSAVSLPTKITNVNRPTQGK